MGAENITAAMWTAQHPEGTKVTAWPGTRDEHGRKLVGTVRSVAWMVGDHLSAMVTGQAGGISIAHIECEARCQICALAWATEQAYRKRRDRNARRRDQRAR